MKRILGMFFFVSICIYPYNQRYVLSILEKARNNIPLIASGVDFRGAGSLLRNTRFSGELSGANFSQNDLNVVPLIGTIKIPGQATDLSGSDFFNTNLVSASFKGANLENVIFDMADIKWADFSGTNLKGARFKGAKNIDKARFGDAIMPDGTNLSYGSWTDVYGSIFNAYRGKKK
ncbi:pentapeptide repeat-containing protein [Candidatus Dependentiae bacterium]|nr:pentapeptide repeat-containing protein [Candidatus Dependentiae bacterium]